MGHMKGFSYTSLYFAIFQRDSPFTTSWLVFSLPAFAPSAAFASSSAFASSAAFATSSASFSSTSAFFFASSSAFNLASSAFLFASSLAFALASSSAFNLSSSSALFLASSAFLISSSLVVFSTTGTGGFFFAQLTTPTSGIKINTKPQKIANNLKLLFLISPPPVLFSMKTIIPSLVFVKNIFKKNYSFYNHSCITYYLFIISAYIT